jgi:hypothetical protein
MGAFGGPDIVTDELKFAVDAGSERSYPGSGTAWKDLIGNNNGVLTNSPTFSSANGGSFDFDGVDDYATVPNSTDVDLTNVGTISVWIKPHSLTQGNFAGFVSKSTGGGNNAQAYVFSWRQASSAIFLSLCNGSSAYNQIFASLPTVANVWYNLVGTWNGSSLTIYNNGVATATGTQTTNAQVLNTALTIGGYTYKGGGGSAEYFNGNIANVKIYKKGFTAAEVLQNYNAQKNRFI